MYNYISIPTLKICTTTQMHYSLCTKAQNANGMIALFSTFNVFWVQQYFGSSSYLGGLTGAPGNAFPLRATPLWK